RTAVSRIILLYPQSTRIMPRCIRRKELEKNLLAMKFRYIKMAILPSSYMRTREHLEISFTENQGNIGFKLKIGNMWILWRISELEVTSDPPHQHQLSSRI